MDGWHQGRRLWLRGATLMSFLLLAAPWAQGEDWFDAYARGLEALKQQKGARAVELFERSIRMRAEPGTNLLTYGTNRLDEYYPYLRLAEAQLLVGNVEAAREALARSEAKGKEPPAQRSRIAGLVDALAKTRVAVASPTPGPPPPTTLAVPPPPVVAQVTTPATTLAPVAPTPGTTLSPVAATGTLDLRSDPEGATALLGGRRLGTTPLTVDLASGAYEITLHKEGAADQTFPVRITAGRPTLEIRTLVATGPAPGPSATPAPAEIASLLVYSEPPGAAVYLDDEALGATDPGSGRLVKSGVAPGTHRLRLTLTDHLDVAQSVDVGNSGPTTVRAVLLPTAPAVSPRVLLGSAAAAGLLILAVGYWAWKRRQPAAPAPTVAVPSRTKSAPARPAPATSASRRGTAISPVTVGAEELNLEQLLETRSLPPEATKGVGERFGDYLLLDPLGKGGMATVFLAERNGEQVALKRPLAAFLEDPEFLERFLREAEIGRTLHHPNIIRIFERGHVDGVPYFTMELVKGETLQAHIRKVGALPGKPATKIVTQVAEALDYAHLKGVVHRDLKPSNIMIVEDGTVKVMDYGIARARRFEGLTVTGAFLGTPDYVAPETAEGKGADARSDLYSLGIVFYEILTGKKPFVGDTPFATLRKHVSEAPTPPSVVVPGLPRQLETIVLRLLQKDPGERYPGAEELLIELREYLNRAA
ncbi:MAG TPA: protein kinase [Vicinamibacteria bacterium]|nr:protein kinase [Vicinamibacteria bacterium]